MVFFGKLRIAADADNNFMKYLLSISVEWFVIKYAREG